MNIKTLLDIEKDESIISYRFSFKNIPIWPYIRVAYFWELQKTLFNLEDPRMKITLSTLPSLSNVINYLYHSTMRNPFRAKKCDVLIIGGSIHNIPRKGKYFNTRYDIFVKTWKKTQLIEKSSKLKHYLPREDKNVLFFDLIPLFSNMFSKLSPKADNQDIENVNGMLRHLHKHGITDVRKFLQGEKKRLLRLASQIKIESHVFGMLLRRARPKILIIEDAHYGRFAHLISLAKELGISVAEFQHGFVSSEHLAYNYHENIINTEYKQYLPDYFLLFGKWWGKFLKTPARKVVIGNPYLLEQARQDNKRKQKKILVISGGTMPQHYIDFGQQIKSQKKLEEYDFLFRPHPAERQLLTTRYHDLKKIGFEWDLGKLYETLKRVEIVVSLEISTVLFEALPFTNKVFLVHSSSNVPSVEQNTGDLPFITCNGVDNFIEMLDVNQQIPQSVIDQIWDPNPIKNYKQFIEEIISK